MTSVSNSKFIAKIIAWFSVVTLVMALIANNIVFPLPEGKLSKPVSTFVYSREGELLRCFTSSDGFWRLPVILNEISPLLKKSVIAIEDSWFYYHPGINIFSLVTSAMENLEVGKVVRGGSTLTMQIARMMEPKPRTMKSKIIELFRALQLELRFTKNELLEIYLNLAPYGGNIEGVGAASYFYFGKTPFELSPGEAALLTALPNSPTVLRPDRHIDNSIAARNRVLNTMLREDIISKEENEGAVNEEIRRVRMKPPFLAPHFCRDLHLSHPEMARIQSTIDLNILSISEGVVQNHIKKLKMCNINNVAVVVLDNSSAEVLTMTGSVDFMDKGQHGQVNGATSPRSPGSTLKPFVYAMALENGLISPATMIEDLPVYYSGYSPENYDEEYRGVISAADALKFSLNVPAVELCARVGLNSFYNILISGRISTLNGRYYDYGLPLVLGACETKLIELTNLYSCLARGGIDKPIKTVLNQRTDDGLMIFSPAVSYIISDILSEVERPDLPACWEFAADLPRIAWKTGTSYGRKDAWTIGYNPHYTVGVWVGNFSGESSPDLVGAVAAAPIMLEVINAISSKQGAGWFAKPENVSTRKVCSISGKPPNDYCTTLVEELYIPGLSPVSRCHVHKLVLVDSETGIRLCRHCAHSKNAVSKTFEDWPPKINTWMLECGRSIAPVPEHNPECNGTLAGDRPIIVSPKEDNVYILRRHLPLELQKILLEASVTSGSRYLYWFLDGELLGRVESGNRLFYTPEAGSHILTCSDDAGRSNSITLKVE
ncbi:MAG: penicillin-binding protein 1C [candidate division Zixibacteria bacterium]|nr:penicillin-binding protein 1C [candidate division Zixibacteria bacterium]